MLSNSKIRAKIKGIVHNITAADLEEIWPKNNRCPVLDTPFEIGYKDGKSKKLAPSLDRIVPKKVYIKVNLLIVSDIVNRMKQDSTLEDMEKILKYYTKLLKKND